MTFLRWGYAQTLPSRTYACAYCGHEVASSLGYATSEESLTEEPHVIYVCSFCSGPTYFRPDGTQFPGIPFGEAVRHLPSTELEALYNEARTVLSVNACAACVLCCRSILTYISVEKGAPQELTFREHVDYLRGNGYVPPDAQDWIEQVLRVGGTGEHALDLVTRQEAEVWLTLVEQLLRFVYEYPMRLSESRRRLAGS